MRLPGPVPCVVGCTHCAEVVGVVRGGRWPFVASPHGVFVGARTLDDLARAVPLTCPAWAGEDGAD